MTKETQKDIALKYSETLLKLMEYHKKFIEEETDTLEETNNAFRHLQAEAIKFISIANAWSDFSKIEEATK